VAPVLRSREIEIGATGAAGTDEPPVAGAPVGMKGLLGRSARVVRQSIR
jgi:hypothetical protein